MKNFCGRAWVAEHPSGTEAEWEAKGSKLPEDEKKKFDREGRRLKKVKGG
ncbi:hypothetical protein EW026_g5742 [Hermanssonia centrifuga]|uniref:Uncharacterized protein n=2 Tax=Hermanssonia centrifuga TaxID=98765 RepID=A0A4V3X9T2_9APHY|nr:hypothetical protein EW026_g7958 [Hermanssonia centrifuga]THG94899.1 hypothetical protein EW026_g6659 [Hermanssonia centrifuga]THG95392.1 hypothetical protein EW026_g6251 [Hermanssonia centrifuga]THG96010.1 hypothetical protein EW026_g5742 [Hermanssonia centrifuga]